MPVFQNINELPDLRTLIREGFISERPHQRFSLKIYNYTKRAQYDEVWNASTRACRGLITDLDGRVHARPFEKFFNLEQLAAIPDGPYDVYEKFDGSLGIMYFADQRPWIATRGSFHSDQANAANTILQDMLAGLRDVDTLKAYTPMFEIIVPESRVVVDYGGERRLMLIGVRHTASGEDLNAAQITQFAQQHGFSDVSQAAAHGSSPGPLPAFLQTQRHNHEGYVIHWHSGERAKVKHNEYVHLHKLMTGTNERAIVRDHVAKGAMPPLDGLPADLRAWIEGVAETAQRAHAALAARVEQKFAARMAQSRKELAAEWRDAGELRPFLFMRLDDKDFSRNIWDVVIERTSIGTFRQDGEG